MIIERFHKSGQTHVCKILRKSIHNGIESSKESDLNKYLVKPSVEIKFTW